ISIERGYDVTEYTLCCFGGAGGQHACLIADTLGMKRVYIHPLAGVLSAYGMGLADLRAIKEQAVEARLEQSLLPRLGAIFAKLAGAAAAEMHAQGVESGDITTLKKAHVKYEGTDVPLAIDYGDLQTLEANFAAAHKQRYGFIAPEKSLIVESLSVEAVGAAGSAEDPVYPEEKSALAPKPVDQVALFAEGAEHRAPVYDR